MACDDPSTLNTYRIGGYVGDLCGGDVETTVTVQLLSDFTPLTDPTNEEHLTTSVAWSMVFSDGCWCTCPLRPNTSDNPGESIEPAGSYYRIQVVAGGQTLVDVDISIHDQDFAALVETDLGGSCGTAIHINDVLADPPTIPPTTSFCDAVQACVTPSTLVRSGASLIFDNASAAAVTIPVCDLLGALADGGGDLPAGARVLADDCEWYTIPASSDTFGQVTTAAAPGTTTNGVPYVAGDQILTFPNGATWASSGSATDTNTFGTVSVAAADFTTTNGVPILTGERYVTFPDGTTWATEPATDTNTFGTVTTAAAALTTTNGVPVALGEQYVTFPDGTTWAGGGSGTDTAGVVATAAAALTTTNGVDVPIGGQYISFPGGTTWAVEDMAYCVQALRCAPDGTRVIVSQAVNAAGALIGTPSYKLEADFSDYAGDTSLLAECPEQDLCTELANLPAMATCPVSTTELVTSACETITVGQIKPQHVIGSASVPAETCTGLTPFVDNQSITSMAETSRFQIGEEVVGPNAADLIPLASVQPLAITVPAATVDCVTIIQVSWGGSTAATGFTPELGTDVNLGNLAGDLANLTKLGTTVASNGGEVYSAIFAADSVGGGAGGSVDATFVGTVADPDGLIDGVLQVYTYQVCGISVADIDVGSASLHTVTGPGGSGNANGDRFPVPTFNLGDGDALLFGIGRHVGPDPGNTPPANLNVDLDWVTATPAINEVLSTASTDLAGACQLGSFGGWVPGGTGDIDILFGNNSTGFVGNNPGQFIALPLNFATAGTPCMTTAATLGATNPSPCDSARQRLTVTGNVCLSVCAGSDVVVTPILNGTELDPIRINNAGNADGVDMCLPYHYSTILPTVIAPGATAPTASMMFRASEQTGAGCAGDAVMFNPWTLESELIHV